MNRPDAVAEHRRLMDIPGVGLLTATAAVATIGEARAQLLELIPKEMISSELEEQEPQPPDEVLPILPPNTDINFSTLGDLHFGQVNSSASRCDKQRCSK